MKKYLLILIMGMACTLIQAQPTKVRKCDQRVRCDYHYTDGSVCPEQTWMCDGMCGKHHGLKVELMDSAHVVYKVYYLPEDGSIKGLKGESIRTNTKRPSRKVACWVKGDYVLLSYRRNASHYKIIGDARQLMFDAYPWLASK